MKSGCSGALKPDRLGLSCKANKCSDVGTGGLGVLPTSHETSPCFSLDDDGPTRLKQAMEFRVFLSMKDLCGGTEGVFSCLALVFFALALN